MRLLLILIITSSLANASMVSGQGTWETTLLPRDLDGNKKTAEAYYDTMLDITWLTNTYSYGNWESVNTWASHLSFGDANNWRLPKIDPIDGSTLDYGLSWIGAEDRGSNMSAPGTIYAGSTASEMAHLYYNTLGNLGDCDPSLSTDSTCIKQNGAGITNNGYLDMLLSRVYWSSTEDTLASAQTAAWEFDFSAGNQGQDPSWVEHYALAVHSGDVAAIPAPPTAWLIAPGLLFLFGFNFSRRRKVSTITA